MRKPWNRRADLPLKGIPIAAAVIAVYAIELIVRHISNETNDILAVMLASVVLGIAAALIAKLLGRILRPALAAFLGLAAAFLPLGYMFVPLIEPRVGIYFGSTAISIGITLGFALTIAAALAALLLAAVGRRLVLAAATAAVIAVLAFQPRHPAFSRPDAGPRPNIILVVLDTARRDHLSLYGYPKPTTPNIDRLARDAQRYQDAWSVAPWTPSSHASMFTGLLPAEHGVDGEAEPSFPAGFATLPEVLRTSGFQTAGFVANPNLVAPGWDRGFDAYRAPWIAGRHSLILLLNKLINGNQDGWLLKRDTPRLLDLAERWWGGVEGRPRFLFLNLLDPHRPYLPPKEMYQKLAPPGPMSEALKIDQDPVSYCLKPGLEKHDAELLTALYDGEIAAMDLALGAFFDWLRARGDLDKSIVVITSDHGEHLGERGLVGHDLVMDPAVLRVPLIIRYPPRLAPGDVAERVQIDGLAGLVLNLVGLPAPEAMSRSAIGRQNRSLVVAQYAEPGWFFSLFKGRAPDFDFSPYRGDGEFVSDGEFAYVTNRGAVPVREWLTVLRDDPDWRHNAASEYPEVTHKLREAAARLPSFHLAGPKTTNPRDRERLRSLGYVR
jgi:arylsulfatase A-like enzyme